MNKSENKSAKKILKVIFCVFIAILIGCPLTLLCSNDPLILRNDTLLNINFILFGFLLTIYTFIVPSLNKLKSKAESNNKTELINNIKDYKKELKSNLIVFFILTIVFLILDFIFNLSIFNNIEWLKNIIQITITSSFIFNIMIILDTTYSVFKIVDLE
ncbi:MAG: hypothetical protein PHQ62_00090 [Clostridia bacterium]|nr:hypothetical protein [Clostridia bacterium]